MTHTSRRPAPSVRRWLAAAAVLALAALTAPLAAGAAGADQPNLPIGTSPAPATASVSPGGQGNACAAGQTAAVDPTASAATDAAQIGAGDCSGGGTAGTSSASTPTGGTGDAGSASGHRTTATAASTSGASTRASVLEAVNASELEITAVRFTTKRVRSARKLGVVVTVRGQQSRPVRNGTVAINDLPTAKIDCLCQRATFTNNAGQAAFTIPVTSSMLGKRLFLQISARTPTLKSTKLVSVPIP